MHGLHVCIGESRCQRPWTDRESSKMVGNPRSPVGVRIKEEAKRWRDELGRCWRWVASEDDDASSNNQFTKHTRARERKGNATPWRLPWYRGKRRRRGDRGCRKTDRSGSRAAASSPCMVATGTPLRAQRSSLQASPRGGGQHSIHQACVNARAERERDAVASPWFRGKRRRRWGRRCRKGSGADARGKL
jgi:hypothetical protein